MKPFVWNPFIFQTAWQLRCDNSLFRCLSKRCEEVLEPSNRVLRARPLLSLPSTRHHCQPWCYPPHVHTCYPLLNCYPPPPMDTRCYPPWLVSCHPPWMLPPLTCYVPPPALHGGSEVYTWPNLLELQCRLKFWAQHMALQNWRGNLQWAHKSFSGGEHHRLTENAFSAFLKDCFAACLPSAAAYLINIDGIASLATCNFVENPVNFHVWYFSVPAPSHRCCIDQWVNPLIQGLFATTPVLGTENSKFKFCCHSRSTFSFAH